MFLKGSSLGYTSSENPSCNFLPHKGEYEERIKCWASQGLISYIPSN